MTPTTFKSWLAKQVLRFVGPQEQANLLKAFRSGEPFPSSYGLSGVFGTDQAMRVSALSACVRLISGNVAKLPIHAFRMRGEDRKRDRKNVVEMLLNRRPNQWQTAFEFRRMMTAHVAMSGNAIAEKVRVGDTVTELIPLHPSTVSVSQRGYGDPPVYRVSVGGSTRILPASDVFHLRDLTLDGVVGLSRVQQASQGIALSYDAETFGASYFRNGAEPGIVLTYDKQLSDDQRTQLSEMIKQRHGGAANAHAPLIAEGGLKVTPLSASNKDSQFIELRSFQVEDIARMYGVPPHLIGLTEKQTSWGTGVEQMAIGFLQFHLLDWLVMWETAIARDLLQDGEFVEHVVEGLLRADIKTRMDAYSVGITNGIISRNEARKMENLPAYDGGDEFLYPTNMTVNGQEADTQTDPVDFPSANAKHGWMAAVLKAQRVIGTREAM